MRSILVARTFSSLAAAACLVATLGHPDTARADSHAPEGPEAIETETGEEQELRARVEARLRRNEFVQAYDLRAEVEGHAVTLRGVVNAQHEKEEAAEAARSVEGVEKVVNEVLVGKAPGDEEVIGPLEPSQTTGPALR